MVLNECEKMKHGLEKLFFISNNYNDNTFQNSYIICRLKFLQDCMAFGMRSLTWAILASYISLKTAGTGQTQGFLGKIE